MTTRTHNPINRTFLLTGVALILSSGSAFAAAGDAQEQARAMLSGVTGDHVSFPVGANDAVRIDPQVQAQRLLTSKPQASSGTISLSASQKTAVAQPSASNLARWLLAGRGS